eukprot:SM001237S25888  [mRNA]  locus=s1237:242:2147:+ [translate_table: standard]
MTAGGGSDGVVGGELADGAGPKPTSIPVTIGEVPVPSLGSVSVPVAQHLSDGGEAAANGSSGKAALGKRPERMSLKGGTAAAAPGGEEAQPPVPSPLETALSDPVSGQLLEDAVVARCGHSFGGEGLRQVEASGQCTMCGEPARGPGGLVANLALRAAACAFREERGRCVAAAP